MNIIQLLYVLYCENMKQNWKSTTEEIHDMTPFVIFNFAHDWLVPTFAFSVYEISLVTTAQNCINKRQPTTTVRQQSTTWKEDT